MLLVVIWDHIVWEIPIGVYFCTSPSKVTAITQKMKVTWLVGPFFFCSDLITYQRNWAFAFEMQLLFKGLSKFLNGVWSCLWTWAVCWRCSACLPVAVTFDILVFLKFLGAPEVARRWAFGRSMKSCCMERGKLGLKNKRSLLSIEWQSRTHKADFFLPDTLPNSGAKWRTLPRILYLSF